jgi:hypothetical protein
MVPVREYRLSITDVGNGQFRLVYDGNDRIRDVSELIAVDPQTFNDEQFRHNLRLAVRISGTQDLTSTAFLRMVNLDRGGIRTDTRNVYLNRISQLADGEFTVTYGFTADDASYTTVINTEYLSGSDDNVDFIVSNIAAFLRCHGMTAFNQAAIDAIQATTFRGF